MHRPNSSPPARILFLDDDRSRASAFLEAHPHAIWVQTVEDCVACLEDPWDEVHLDHDLSGETFVDQARPDCGMAVVRWILREPRPQLSTARFVIHSRNTNAASVMLFHLQVAGYQAQERPFQPPPRRRGGPLRRILAGFRRVLATPSR